MLGYSFMIILFLNVIAYIYFAITFKDDEKNRAFQFINNKAYLTGAYTKKNPNYFDEYIDDYIAFIKNGGEEISYHPATEYQMGEMQTKFQTVIKNNNIGFNYREHDPNNQSKEIVVFCIGGSTTYGTLVKDQHTYPYFLEKILHKKIKNRKVKVYNFGVGSFSPSEESKLFLYLLQMGHRPSVVVFLDGVNLGAPHAGTELSSAFERKIKRKNLRFRDIGQAFSQLPLIKLIKGESYFFKMDFFKDKERDLVEFGFTDSLNNLMVHKFYSNFILRQKIADLYSVKIIQYLQPTVLTNNQLNLVVKNSRKYLLSKEGKKLRKNFAFLYNQLLKKENTFIDLSNLFNEKVKHPLIEFTHYSPDFNYILAMRIAKDVSESCLINYYFDKHNQAVYPYVH